MQTSMIIEEEEEEDKAERRGKRGRRAGVGGYFHAANAVHAFLFQNDTVSKPLGTPAVFN